MIQISGLDCCGGCELIGINDSDWTPKRWLLYYVNQWDIMDPYDSIGKAFVVFSYAWDVGNNKSPATHRRSRKQGSKRMKEWRAFIEDNGLGTVTIPRRSQFNWNYGKSIRIRAGLWVPDQDAIRAFVKEQGWAEAPKKWHFG